MPEPNMRILVVDEFSAVRRVIRNMLNTLGYQNADEADGCDAALEKLQTEPFDFVIADWNLPSGGALDLLTAMRADKRFQHVPALMVTPDSMETDVALAVQQEGAHFASKPLTIEGLRAILERVF